MSGPGLSTADLVGIVAFAANYAVVAPGSVVCVVVAIARRRRHLPVWLAPIAILNVLVAGTQLVLFGADLEGWLAALLGGQIVGALTVLVWVLRARAADACRQERK
jgi:hypothetical protein